MVELNKKLNTIKLLVIYLILFYMSWTIYAVFLSPLLDKVPLGYSLLGKNLIKLGCWTITVVLIIRFLFKQKPLSYLKLDKDILKGLLYGTLSGAVIILYIALRKHLIEGNVHFDPFFDLKAWVGGVLLIGVTEEVVFRGFILQKLEVIMRFKYANATTSILFVLIHFPRWYNEGSLFSAGFMMNSILFLLLFSYIQGVMFKKTGSLWACFIFHSANNFAMFALN